MSFTCIKCKQQKVSKVYVFIMQNDPFQSIILFYIYYYINFICVNIILMLVNVEIILTYLFTVV